MDFATEGGGDNRIIDQGLARNPTDVYGGPMPSKASSTSKSPPARPGPVLDDLPFHLPRVFYAFLGLVERRLAATGLDKHLRPGMPTILFALYEEDDCILKELKRRVMLAHNTLSTLLRRMEEAGLVKCRPCEEDGRAIRVRLTKLGRSLEGAVREFHRGVTVTLEGSFSKAEAETLRRLLGRLCESIRTDEPEATAKKK
jgi:DNA-binding MarR family transcriptional regulator